MSSSSPIPNPFLTLNNGVAFSNTLLSINNGIDVAMYIIVTIRDVGSRLALSTLHSEGMSQRQVEAVIRSNITSAVHYLLIKHYSDWQNTSINTSGNTDESNTSSTSEADEFQRLQYEVHQIFIALRNALQLNQLSKEQYSNCILYIFSTCKFQHKNMNQQHRGRKKTKIPKDAMIKLHKMLDTLKKIFLFLIPDMDSKHRKPVTNELMLSPAYVLTKSNTAKLSLYSICLNVSCIERQLRFQILKHWPHLHGSGMQILHGKQMQEMDGDDKLFQMFKIVATNHNRDAYHILSNLTFQVKYSYNMIRFWNICWNNCVIKKGMYFVNNETESKLKS